MMALVEEGHVSPIAEQVAERAQVGLRSVFRHFNDMDSLYAEMAMRLARYYQPALAPFASEDWRGQLFEAIDRRIAVYEQMLPFKQAADAHRHNSLLIKNSHAETSRLMRLRLRGMLPPALQQDVVAFETLDFLLSLDSWQRLRVEQQLSPEVARAVVERLIASLVGSE